MQESTQTVYISHVCKCESFIAHKDPASHGDIQRFPYFGFLQERAGLSTWGFVVSVYCAHG